MPHKGKILLEDECTEVLSISFHSLGIDGWCCLSHALSMVTRGYQSLISLPNTLMLFSFYHFELSASCWCHEEDQRVA